MHIPDIAINQITQLQLFSDNDKTYEM